MPLNGITFRILIVVNLKSQISNVEVSMMNDQNEMEGEHNISFQFGIESTRLWHEFRINSITFTTKNLVTIDERQAKLIERQAQLTQFECDVRNF